MVAGDKRRSAKNLEAKTLPYFVDICQRANNTRDACLMALLFLSGRRVSELVGLKKRDLQLSNDFLIVTTFNEKTFRYTAKKEYKIEKHGTFFQYFKNENGETFTVPKEIRYYPEIKIDISRSTPVYIGLGRFIEDHLATLKDDDYIFERLKGKGHIGSSMVYLIVCFLDSEIWPHWFRHQRFTQVYNVAKANVKDPFDVVMTLHDFTKHRDIDTTMNYIHRLKLQEIKKEI